MVRLMREEKIKIKEIKKNRAKRQKWAIKEFKKKMKRNVLKTKNHNASKLSNLVN